MALFEIRVSEYKGHKVDGIINWKLEHLINDCSSMSIGGICIGAHIRPEDVSDFRERQQLYHELKSLLYSLVPHCLFSMAYYSDTSDESCTWKLVFSHSSFRFEEDAYGEVYESLLSCSGNDVKINNVLGWEGEEDFEIRILQIPKSYDACTAPSINFDDFVGKFAWDSTNELSGCSGRTIEDRADCVKRYSW